MAWINHTVNHTHTHRTLARSHINGELYIFLG